MGRAVRLNQELPVRDGLGEEVAVIPAGSRGQIRRLNLYAATPSKVSYTDHRLPIKVKRDLIELEPSFVRPDDA